MSIEQKSFEWFHPTWYTESSDPQTGHVYIRDKDTNILYKWFWDKENDRVILVSGDERTIKPEEREAMKHEVRTTLEPQIPSRAQ